MLVCNSFLLNKIDKNRKWKKIWFDKSEEYTSKTKSQNVIQFHSAASKKS